MHRGASELQATLGWESSLRSWGGTLTPGIFTHRIFIPQTVFAWDLGETAHALYLLSPPPLTLKHTHASLPNSGWYRPASPSPGDKPCVSSGEGWSSLSVTLLIIIYYSSEGYSQKTPGPQMPSDRGGGPLPGRDGDRQGALTRYHTPRMMVPVRTWQQRQQLLE